MPESLPTVLPVCAPTECGKEFKHRNRRPSPNYTKAKRGVKIRTVPAFTIQALQKNTRVEPPPSCGVYDPRPIAEETSFRKCYLRGEFPVSIEFTKQGKRLGWRIPVEKLDYGHYLPLLLDGLSEGTYPFNFIVEKGIEDMVTKAPHKVLPAIPQIIIPIKRAFETRRETVMCYAMRCVKKIVDTCPNVGIALVPYYRQLLPMISLFKLKKRGVEEEITVPEQNVGFLMDEMLQSLERNGGPDAFINMKYMIPTYESAAMN